MMGTACPYERGLQLAPNDPDLKESAERVRPFATNLRLL